VSNALFFLTGTRLSGDALSECLASYARKGRETSGVELQVGPETRVSTSPWALWPVDGGPRVMRNLAKSLVEISTALAVQEDHEIIALWIDPDGQDGRLSRAVPGEDAEVLVASRERIAATLATWLGVSAERVGVALGLMEPVVGDDEPPPDNAQLEEESYVSRKLDEARAWMARWVAENEKDA
jgi:hypothetical protein